MRVRTAVLAACVLALLAFGPTALLAQNQHTYTFSFYHDGINTDSYTIIVDGTAVPTTVTCTGTGATRLCSTPLTLTMDVAHTIIYQAVNIMGVKAALSPFTAAPPSTPPSGATLTK
jgi:hypothetical protein